MVEYLRGLEPRRGCGFRKVGKLYVVGKGLFSECHRLPIPLTICPVCGGGVKFARSWIKISPLRLFGACSDYSIRCIECGEEMTPEGKLLTCKDCRISIDRPSEVCQCGELCPACNPPENAYLLWVGEKFYPTPRHFVLEALELGVSKAVPMIPRDFELGKTIVYLAHRKAVKTYYMKNGVDVRWHAGIFMTFKPTHFELLVKETDYKINKGKYDEMEQRGIKIIIVPDNYDKMVEKAEAEYKKKVSRAGKKKAEKNSMKLTYF